MTRAWNGKSVIDELADRLWDDSTTFRSKIIKWVNEIQDDLVSELPIDHFNFRLKKLLPLSQEVINLDPQIPTAPSVDFTTTQTSLLYNTTTASNYTYNSTDIKFDSTDVYLGVSLESNETFRNTFSTASSTVPELGIGTLESTNTGTITVENGFAKFDAAPEYITFNSDNIDYTNTGTIRLFVQPQYTGMPSTITYLYATTETLGGVNNAVQILHRSSNGNLNITIYSSAGSLLVNQDVAWSPVAGQDYVLELGFNTSTGNYYFFINGVSQTITGSTGTRTDTTALFRVGAGTSGSATSNPEFWLSAVQVFNTVQNTATHTTPLIPLYSTDNPRVALTTGVTVGELSAFSESATKPTGTEIKYIIDVNGTEKYFNGTAWATSDGTYSQANTASEVNTNATTLISESSTLKVIALLNTTDNQETPELVSVTLTDIGDLVSGTTYRFGVTFSIYDDDLKDYVESEMSSYSSELTADFDNQQIELTNIDVYDGDTSVSPTNIYRNIYISSKASGATEFTEPFFKCTISDNTTTSLTVSNDTVTTVTPPSDSELDQLSSDHMFFASGNNFLQKIDRNKVRRFDPSGSSSATPDSFDYIGTNKIRLYPVLASGATTAQRTLVYGIYRRVKEIFYDVDRVIDLPISAKKALIQGVVWKAYEYRDRDGKQSELSNYEAYKREFIKRMTRQRGRPQIVRDVNGDTFGFEV